MEPCKTTRKVRAFSRLRVSARQGRHAILAGFFVALLSLGGSALPASHADAAAYQAKEMIRSLHPVVLAPGASTTFTIGFKNEGTTTWRKDGGNFVSIYTHGPKYRQSAFRTDAWYRDVQPVRSSSDVAPGVVGMFTFALRAPATPGTYQETFHLAAEDLLWIPGGAFTVSIEVRAQPVLAAPEPAPMAQKGYAAQPVYRSVPRVELAPGGRLVYEVGYKNVGSTTWSVGKGNYASVYTWGPKYRKSVFEDDSWYRSEQPGIMTGPDVTPGNVGYVKFYLKAPSTPGTYRESFHLAAEDLLWIPGGEIAVDIVVSDSPSSGSSGSGSTAPPPPPPPPMNEGNGPTANGYAALKMISSGARLTVESGALSTYRVAFKNTGDKAWLRFGEESVYMRPIDVNAEAFRTTAWDGPVAARLQQDAVYPGQLAMFDIRLNGPESGGSFLPRFSLHVGERSISGGSIEIPVEVLRGESPTSVGPVDGDPVFSGSGDRGPIARIGLFHTREPIVIAAAGTYRLLNGDHQDVRTLSGVTSITYDFGTGVYTVRNGGFVYTTDKHVHFYPDDPSTTIFEVQSYENRPTWDTSINFNKFRGNLEVFYTSATGRLWLIEELPIEDYLRGLAETSNGSPYEYQKALVTAARTYALYVLAIGGKHKSEFHHLNTTAGDQVYKGYASELVRPNVVKAVEETRGQAVHYGGELVVTPYYSRSDGRTRAWTEVWGGSTRPWLLSVPAPYDQGKTLWGHGVGMSASDAVGRAADGASWTDILRYYYTGIEIRRMY